MAILRRSFLGLLVSALAVGWPRPDAAPHGHARDGVCDGLTGRIVGSLNRRAALGYPSRSIHLSPEGFDRVQGEHGFSLNRRAHLQIRGVPCVISAGVNDHEYWVLS